MASWAKPSRNFGIAQPGAAARRGRRTCRSPRWRPTTRRSGCRGSARRRPRSRLQHVAHARAERQVGVADDRLGDAARAVIARRAHGGDAVDELDLAHRRHLGRAVLAVHRLAFEEHGGDDVVAAADVGQQLGQEVAAALRRVPEMMVRIDDRQFRLQRRLGRPLRQPRLQVGVVADRSGRDIHPWRRLAGPSPSPLVVGDRLTRRRSDCHCRRPGPS